MSTTHISNIKTALLFAFTMVVSISTIYEIVEWLAAAILHPELGMAFLGTQGDVWDSQKDTLMAIGGALINIVFFHEHYKKLLDIRSSKKPEHI
jgi:putative membrane protein